MPKRSSTRKPKEDFSQTAFRIVQELTGEKAGEEPDIRTVLANDAIRSEIMREMGRRGGKKGGKARAAKLTDRQRTKIAKAAAAIKWRKYYEKKQSGD